MKRTWKQIGSLLLAACMVLTMLPMTVFAETGGTDSGTPLGTSGTITAIGSLDTKVAKQTVETGTAEGELNLPGTLAVTVTENGDETATGSDAQKETQTTVAVESWTSDPAYDDNTEGDYIFTPELNLSKGLTLADGVTPPTITVTLTAPAAPMLPRGGMQPMASGDFSYLIVNSDTPVDATKNQSGSVTGGTWAWTAATSTLTLTDGTYSRVSISTPEGTGTANIVVSGTVNVQGDGINTGGSLAFTGSSTSDTLTVNGGGTIFANNAVSIENITVNVSAAGQDDTGIMAGAGGFSMSSGVLTVSATGDDAFGIYCNGNVSISGTAQVTVNSKADAIFGSNVSIGGDAVVSAISENGVGISSALSGGTVTITGGTVTAKGKTAVFTSAVWGYVTVMGGSLTTGDVGGTNGNITGRLTVDGTASTVTVNGGIKKNASYSLTGDLDVSAGTVTVTGDVDGNKNLTGGTVWVNGFSVYPTVLGVPTTLAWDGTTPGKATWNAVDNVINYSVQLYKDGVEEGSPVNSSIITACDFTSIIAAAGAGSYTFKVTAQGDGTSYLSSPPSAVSAAYVYTPGGGTTTYTATLYIRGDDVPFTSQNSVYTLKLESDESTAVTMSGGTGATRTADVLNGTWKVYEDSTSYTGVTITVNNAPASATLDYYKVNYSNTLQGAASNGMIYLSAMSLGGDMFDNLPSGSWLLKGDKATFNAVGAGAKSYTYAWSGTHVTGTISGTEDILVINPVQGKVDISCTITGSGTAEVPVPGNSGAITASGVTQDSLMLNWTKVTSTEAGKLRYFVLQSSSSNLSTLGDCMNHPEAVLNPAGVEDSDTYLVTGLSPNTTYYFNVVVMDDDMNAAAYTMVSATTTGGGTAPTITTTLTDTYVGYGMYAVAWEASGTEPFTWSLASGTLPPGLNFSGGGIDGNPTTEGTYTFTIKVTNAFGSDTKEFTIRVYPAGTTIYTVTFNLNGGTRTGGGELTQSVASGGSATAPTISRSGYTFSGWDKAFTNVTSNLTVTASWSYNGGGGGGGGGGTSVVTPPAEQPKAETTTSGNTATATTTATATVNGSGTAMAAVTQAQVSDAIAKAAEAAAKQGSGTAAVVEIKVDAPANAKTVETSIPKAAMELAADGKTAALTVSTPVASLSFDAAALSTIAGEAAGTVKVTASKVEASTLSAETQQLIGDRPVFNFSVTSGGQTISQFGGSVSVSVPYTPKAGEDLNAIVIYYINAAGKPEVVSNCSYDPATGTISFKTSHFSKYAVGYNKVTFQDVAENAWYGKAVSFIAARDITTGTGNGNYSPDAKLTRGEFIVMLMKAYGIAPGTNSADNFADAGDTYYTGYLAAAKGLGISGGVGDNLFAPGREITRQEMFTLLYNALKAIGELPEGNTGKSLSAFSDAGQVASWAKEAMTLMVKTGTVSGSGGKLTPKETTTRAQMAQVLYNLMRE